MNGCVKKSVEMLFNQVRQTGELANQVLEVATKLDEAAIEYEQNAYSIRHGNFIVSEDSLPAIRRTLGRMRLRYKSALSKTEVAVHLDLENFPHIQVIYPTTIRPGGRCEIVEQTSSNTHLSLVCDRRHA